MDIEQFGQFKNGVLLPIVVGDRNRWAFVPAPLPANWKFPESLWPLLLRAREAITELNTAAGSLPNPLMLLGALRRREAIKSSTIEDTTVTPEELIRFEKDAPGNSPQTPETDDAREVFNCAEALRVGRERLRIEPLSLALLKNLHALLLSRTRMAHKSPGQFRQRQVFVGRNFTPPPPGEPLAECLSNFEQYVKSPNDSLDPLIRAFVAHYQFEAIHPFEDGNGRIGRVLLALMICRDLGLKEPWVCLSGYFEHNRREYYDRLLGVSTHGDWSEWVQFCLEGAADEARSAIDKCTRLRELREDYRRRLADHTPRADALIDHLFAFPLIEISVVAGILGVAYNTARADVGKLVQAGVLTELKGYPQAFRADEIMNITFPPDD